LVLLSDAYDHRGGGEIVVAHLAGALRDRWDVSVVTTTRGGDDRVEADGVPVYRIHSAYHPRLRPIVSLMNPMVTRKLGPLLDRLRPDVVHAWNVHSHVSYDALRMAGKRTRRVVLTFQDAQPFCYSKFHCWLAPGVNPTLPGGYRASPRTCRSCKQHWWMFPPRNRITSAYLHHHVDARASVSQALADALRANDIAVDRVVHNGLPLDDPAVQAANGERARARHGWGEWPMLITGGRLHHFKGHRLAVEVFSRVASGNADARLAILGDRGWFRDALAEQANALGIGDRVVFPGFLDRVAYHDAVKASVAFLNLSMYMDPFPTVNLEAMALGVPVVGTRHGGTPEAVADGVTGVIVDPYAVDAVAEQAQRLLRDGALRRSMGAAGAKRVRDLFTVTRMAGDYEEMYAWT
jgi:glycosyltransferase involved in cell wall biosynthesis